MRLLILLTLVASAYACPLNEGISAKKVAVGSNFACGLLSNGTITCWGACSVASVCSPPSLTNPVALSAAKNHKVMCAIDDTGVVCWGDMSQWTVPTPTLSNPTHIDMGHQDACALDDNGVHCWGRNFRGTATIPALTNPTDVSIGELHACAIHDGGVECWGFNNAALYDIPAVVNPTRIFVNHRSACVVDDNGLTCWGMSVSGVAGSEPDLTGIKHVAISDNLACAHHDGGITCWGANLAYAGPMPDPVYAFSYDMYNLYQQCVVSPIGFECTHYNPNVVYPPPTIRCQPCAAGETSAEGSTLCAPLDLSSFAADDLRSAYAQKVGLQCS